MPLPQEETSKRKKRAGLAAGGEGVKEVTDGAVCLSSMISYRVFSSLLIFNIYLFFD